MGILDRFRRKKDYEAARIARLLATGRIVEGELIDVLEDPDGNVVQIFFVYEVGGVDYDSSQQLNPEQQRTRNRYLPGARLTIRYDPHQPANCVVV